MMRNQPKYKFFSNWSYAMAGFVDILKSERSFRLELTLFSLLIASLFVLKFSSVINLALIFSMVIVLICEAINSAIERVVDLASPIYHELAKRSKDAGSCAVMIANFLCGGLYLYALVEKFYG